MDEGKTESKKKERINKEQTAITSKVTAVEEEEEEEEEEKKQNRVKEDEWEKEFHAWLMEQEGNQENVEETVVWPTENNIAQVIGHHKVRITNTIRMHSYFSHGTGAFQRYHRGKDTLLTQHHFWWAY